MLRRNWSLLLKKKKKLVAAVEKKKHTNFYEPTNCSCRMVGPTTLLLYYFCRMYSVFAHRHWSSLFIIFRCWLKPNHWQPERNSRINSSVQWSLGFRAFPARGQGEGLGGQIQNGVFSSKDLTGQAVGPSYLGWPEREAGGQPEGKMTSSRWHHDDVSAGV